MRARTNENSDWPENETRRGGPAGVRLDNNARGRPPAGDSRAAPQGVDQGVP